MKKEIGRLVRVDYDDETKEMHILIEIDDSGYKKEILHHKDLQYMINIKEQKLLVEE